MTNEYAGLVQCGEASDATPVWLVEKDKWKEVLGNLDEGPKAWIEANHYKAEAGQMLALPGEGGAIACILWSVEKKPEPGRQFVLAGLRSHLPAGTYSLVNPDALPDLTLGLLGFAMEGYEFSRYKKAAKKDVKLHIPRETDWNTLKTMLEGVFLARDLVNTPANDMGPEALEEAARQLARKHEARLDVVRNQDHLKKNYPLIYAVGAAATEERAPRLIDMRWGHDSHPKITLVGKGVCFDTGGLDLKTASSMRNMKKDMGGAANVLGLAHMIMAAKLAVRLRVLIPAVENAIGSRAFRPGDVYVSRKGLSVEIDNTDAEGRLVLADALSLADEESPELILDMATLTGAARVALGPDLPALMTTSDELGQAWVTQSMRLEDPLWRLPLWNRYKDLMKSSVADLNHCGSGGFAGAITAALFLQAFVEKAKAWAHIDLFAWTPGSLPGRPEGGAAQGIRTVFNHLKTTYPPTN